LPILSKNIGESPDAEVVGPAAATLLFFGCRRFYFIFSFGFSVVENTHMTCLGIVGGFLSWHYFLAPKGLGA